MDDCGRHWIVREHHSHRDQMVKLKVAQSCLKVAQKVATTVCTLKIIFKKSQKVSNYLDYFCKKNRTQKLPNLAPLITDNHHASDL